MTLLQPLWLLLALPAMAWIVLLHARRRRVIKVPSLVAWHAMAGHDAERASRRVPPPSWPLVAQLFAVFLVALALAEPAEEHVADVHAVVVIGTPAAADGNRALERVVGGLREGARLTVLDARGGVDPLIAYVPVDRAVSALRSRLADADALPQWSAAADQLARVGLSEGTIVTAVTGPHDAAAAFESLTLSLPHVTVLVDTYAGDRSEFALMADAVSGGASEELRLHVQFVSARPIATRATLEIHAEERVVMARDVTFDGVETRWLDLPLEPLPTARFELRLVDRDDGQTLASIWREPALHEALDVLIVGRELPRLEHTLAALDGVRVARSDSVPNDVRGIDLLIVHAAEVHDVPAVHTMWIGMAPPHVAFGAPITGPWTAIVEEHEVLMPAGMAHEFEVATLIPMALLPAGEVLARAEAYPLIQARQVDGRAEVIVAFNLEASDWEQHASFPVLVMRLLRWMEPSFGRLLAPTCALALPCALPVGTDEAGTVVTAPDGAVEQVGRLHRDPTLQGTSAAEKAAVAGFRPWFVPRVGGWHVVSSSDRERALWVDLDTPTVTAGPVNGEAFGVPTAVPWVLRLRPIMVALASATMILVLALAWTIRSPGGRAPWRVVAPRRRALIIAVHVALVVVSLAAIVSLPWPRGWVVPPTVVVRPAPMERTVVADGALASWIDDASRAGPTASVLAADPPWIERETGGSWQRVPEGLRSGPDDLAAGLAWAAALLADEPRGRIVVAAPTSSHGTFLQRVVDRLARTAVDVAWIAQPGFASPTEIVVEPARLVGSTWSAAAGRVVADLLSARQQTAQVRVFADGILWGEVASLVPAGRSSISFDVPELPESPVVYELEVSGDAEPNDRPVRSGLVVQGRAATRVAVLADGISWALLFAQLLEVHGLDSVLIDPAKAPRTPEGWSEFDAVVLLDLPAITLLGEQQRSLEMWVEEVGGGVLILGGEQTFGPGGYHLTAIDDLSPLSSEIPMDRPDVALVFVLDRSGSMVQAVGPTTRLEIAREATWEAIQLLDPRSQVGIVVFDSASTLIHPVRTIADLTTVRRSLDLLRAGGGTALYPALVQAHGALEGVGGVQRHIVVMTDGLTQSGDFDEIMANIVSDEITVSAVAIGRGASYPRLELIARQSGGAFYATVDFTLLPSIMAQEVLLLTTDPIRLGTLPLVWSETAVPFGTDLVAGLPPIGGLVRTTVKPGATVHATTTDGDVVLASWRYGLGRVAAFTSHGAGPWTMAWLAEPGVPRFWAEALRWVGAHAVRPGLEVRTALRGDSVMVEVLATAPGGRPLTVLPLETRWITEDEQFDGRDVGTWLPLAEVEPGRYRTLLGLPDTGLYRIEVRPAMATLLESVDVGVFKPVRGTSAWGPGTASHIERVVGVLGGARFESPNAVPLTPAASWSWRGAAAWRPWLVLALTAFLLAATTRYRGRGAIS